VPPGTTAAQESEDAEPAAPAAPAASTSSGEGSPPVSSRRLPSTCAARRKRMRAPRVARVADVQPSDSALLGIGQNGHRVRRAAHGPCDSPSRQYNDETGRTPEATQPRTVLNRSRESRDQSSAAGRIPGIRSARSVPAERVRRQGCRARSPGRARRGRRSGVGYPDLPGTPPASPFTPVVDETTGRSPLSRIVRGRGRSGAS
jgi:hypothetical protein